MKKPEIDVQSKRIMVDTKTYSKIIDALILSHGIIKEYLQMNDAISEGDVDVTEWELVYYAHCEEKIIEIEQSLTKAGVCI